MLRFLTTSTLERQNMHYFFGMTTSLAVVSYVIYATKARGTSNLKNVLNLVAI